MYLYTYYQNFIHVTYFILTYCTRTAAAPTTHILYSDFHRRGILSLAISVALGLKQAFTTAEINHKNGNEGILLMWQLCCYDQIKLLARISETSLGEKIFLKAEL